jgi:hypothetical protein
MTINHPGPSIRYTGTKTLHAWPMTRGAYNEYRGWPVPAPEDPKDAGYLVEYEDGGKANDSRHAGYISWSPADVFEKAYRTIGSHQDRVRNELADRTAELDRLSAFCAGPSFDALSTLEKQLMTEQQGIMMRFVDVLARRIAAFPD